MVLERLRRDLEMAQLPSTPIPTPIQVDSGTAIVSEGAGFTDPLILEEMAFRLVQRQEPASLPASVVPNDLRDDFQRRSAVIEDGDFQYLAQHATQVSARIALKDETKTTSGAGGNLWYEETLPPETIMYAVLLADRPRHQGHGTLQTAGDVLTKLKELLADGFLQVGGNETVGQGWCRVTMNGASS